MLTHVQLPRDTQEHTWLEEVLDSKEESLNERIREMDVSLRGCTIPKGQPSQPVPNQLEVAPAPGRNVHPTHLVLRRARKRLQIGNTENQLRCEVILDRIPLRMRPLSMVWGL